MTKAIALRGESWYTPIKILKVSLVAPVKARHILPNRCVWGKLIVYDG
jgi:hypothetical protein